MHIYAYPRAQAAHEKSLQLLLRLRNFPHTATSFPIKVPSFA